MENPAPRVVIGTQGTRYELGDHLGSGGQGSVYRVSRRRAVKLIHEPDSRSGEKLKHQLARVNRYDFSGISIARPIETIRDPDVGYVMEFLEDMTSLKSLLPPLKHDNPLHWFIETGGVRRRLQLLSKFAAILAKLHGKGLVFGDPSPNNVFISGDSDFCEVWLIDADNIASENSNGVTPTFTPGYGAPEVVRGVSRCTRSSDAYSFAIIAFELLTLIHPFIGDAVSDGPPELEQTAFLGELPWVDDPTDMSNRSSKGLSRDLCISAQLKDGFRQVFEKGRTISRERPSMARWSRLFADAAQATVICENPECGLSYFVSEWKCPGCEADLPDVDLVSISFDPRLRTSTPLKRVLQESCKISISAKELCIPLEIEDALCISRNGNEIVFQFELDGVKAKTSPDTRWLHGRLHHKKRLDCSGPIEITTAQGMKLNLSIESIGSQRR